MPGGRRASAVVLARLALAGTLAVPAAHGITAAVATVSGSGPLEATITAETLRIRQGPGGDEIRAWEPAERLSAGDEVHYTVRVRNPGEEPVKDVVVTKRLPFGVRYQAGSAAGPACDIQFSDDGGRTFRPADPTGRSVSAQARKSARRSATGDYSHLRWILRKPLAPGATALLRFRATFS